MVFALTVVPAIYTLVGIGLPWALSLLTTRYGWTERGPGIWNWLGLIPVAAGIAGIVWVCYTMFSLIPTLPETIELDEGEHFLNVTSRILITYGPFALSRNPMFFSGCILMLGWAIFYGSAAILAFAVIAWSLSNWLKVPQEERGLEARFGEEYRAYLARVPRWVGIVRRDGRGEALNILRGVQSVITVRSELLRYVAAHGTSPGWWARGNLLLAAHKAAP